MATSTLILLATVSRMAPMPAVSCMSTSKDPAAAAAAVAAASNTTRVAVTAILSPLPPSPPPPPPPPPPSPPPSFPAPPSARSSCPLGTMEDGLGATGRDLKRVTFLELRTKRGAGDPVLGGDGRNFAAVSFVNSVPHIRHRRQHICIPTSRRKEGRWRGQRRVASLA